MTNVVRQTGNHPENYDGGEIYRTLPEEEERYKGTASELGYEVRWPWITLPALLVLLSTMILIVTIINTQRSDINAWRSSPLALVFMDVDPLILKNRVDYMKNTKFLTKRPVEPKSCWRATGKETGVSRSHDFSGQTG